MYGIIHPGVMHSLSLHSKETLCVTSRLPRMGIIQQNKTCAKQPLKIDKTKNIMTNNGLMKVESIAEYSKGSPWSILQYF